MRLSNLISTCVILTDFGKEGDPTNLLDRYWARIEVSERVTTIHMVCQSNETAVCRWQMP